MGKGTKCRNIEVGTFRLLTELGQTALLFEIVGQLGSFYLFFIFTANNFNALISSLNIALYQSPYSMASGDIEYF